MHKLFQCFNKHKVLVLYCAFGMLTTVVNYCVYFPLYYSLCFTAVLSNSIAWFVSVLFAFFTNKPLVFGCKDWSLKTVSRELVRFFGCRFFTGVLETGFIFVAVDLLDLHSVACKLGFGIVLVAVNYLSNKKYVFKEK